MKFLVVLSIMKAIQSLQEVKTTHAACGDDVDKKQNFKCNVVAGLKSFIWIENDILLQLVLAFQLYSLFQIFACYNYNQT
uniref:Secreted protein n=1 Tax=Arion vulgaris TaxID=1028688 RepID=A0A0B7AKM7_9EUPU